MRILFLGDVVGRTGRDAVRAALPKLREALRTDLVVVNAENASHGFGLAPEMARDLFAAGADAITLGNHAWDRKELIPYIAETPRLIRPLNFPPGTPGAGSVVVDLRDGRRALVVNAMGRLFMDALDCPFRATAVELSRHRLGASVAATIIDFHAEATSDMQLMGRYLDGRVSAVLGTHTHVPTADEQILPGGTAFQCDVGMTGPHDSVLGRRVDRVMEATLTFNPTHFEVASGDVRLNGTIVDVDPQTGRASAVRRLCVTQAEADALAGAGGKPEVGSRNRANSEFGTRNSELGI